MSSSLFHCFLVISASENFENKKNKKNRLPIMNNHIFILYDDINNNKNH